MSHPDYLIPTAMNQPIHFLGVDVSKDTLHTNYQTATDANNQPLWHYQIIDNLIPAIEEWAAQLPPTPRSSSSTPQQRTVGTYSARLAWVLAAQGIAFTALLSSQSAGFAKTLKSISKSDRRDAVLLTRYGQVNQPEPTPLAPESLHQLRQAQRYLHELRVQASGGHQPPACADL